MEEETEGNLGQNHGETDPNSLHEISHAAEGNNGTEIVEDYLVQQHAESQADPPAPAATCPGSPSRASSQRAPCARQDSDGAESAPLSPTASEGSSTANPVQEAPAQEFRPRTRSQSGISKPKIFTDGTIRYVLLSSTGEPLNLQEAVADSNWKRAIQEEYSTLLTNSTWHLVPPVKEKISLIANGPIELNKSKMGQQTDTRLDW